jgi:hypothetical protein
VAVVVAVLLLLLLLLTASAGGCGCDAACCRDVLLQLRGVWWLALRTGVVA